MTTTAPSVFYNPLQYNVDYALDNTMNIFGPIVTSTVNAYSDTQSNLQNLVLGATSNVLIEAMEGVNIYFDDSNALTIYNTALSNNTRIDTSILTVSNSNNRAQVIATSIPLELYGSDAMNTTKVSRTTLTASNMYQRFTTSQDQFLFDQPITLGSNFLAKNDIVSHQNIACTGNVYSSTFNLFKNKSANQQVAYSFYINEHDQLELIKFNRDVNGAIVTSQKKRMATFGKLDNPYVAGELSNFTSIEQFSGITGASPITSTGVTTNMTSILWGAQSGTSNIHYTIGNVGIGTSAPTAALHVANGNMKIAGHIIPEADILYDLGTSNCRFRSLYIADKTIYMGDASISLSDEGTFKFTTPSAEKDVDLSAIEATSQSASNLAFAISNVMMPPLTQQAIFGSNVAITASNIAASASLIAISASNVANSFGNSINTASNMSVFASNAAVSASNVAFSLSEGIVSSSNMATAAFNAVVALSPMAFFASNSAGGAALKANNLNDLTNITSARSNLGLGPASAVTFSNLILQGSIMPTQNSVQYIGTSNYRFKEAWIDSLHIAQNTLYLGDTPVLGTSGDTIDIKADPDQSINIRTTGTGSTLMTSCNEVQISSSGLNTQVKIQTTGAGSRVVFGSSNEISFTAPNVVTNAVSTFNGNVSVNGNLVVTGSNVVANVQTVTVKDNIIVINNGEVGFGVTALQAGLRVDRGDAPDYLMVFDETEDMFRVGEVNQLETIASQPWVRTNALQKSSNLSDLPNLDSARSNIGLGINSTVSFSNLNLSGNLGIGASNTSQYRLFVNGEIHSTGMVTSLSDSNFKTEFQEITDSLNKVDQLTGYTFVFNNDTNPEKRRYAGVIAQEVQKVLPEAVMSTLTGELSVTYGNLSALLINAIKDLKKEVYAIKSHLSI
jgi:hypothetical protein